MRRAFPYALVAAAAIAATVLAAGSLDDVQDLLKRKAAAERQLAALIQEENSARTNLDADVAAQARATSPAARTLYGEAIESLRQTLAKNQAGQSAAKKMLSDIAIRGPELCRSIDEKILSDRDALDRQLEANDTSQDQLEAWSKLSEKSQGEALKASVSFVVGEYVADVDELSGSARKLERRVEELARKGRNARKVATRTKFVNQMHVAIDEAVQARRVLAGKTAAKTVADLHKNWEFVKKDMQQDLRVAQKHDETLRGLLNQSAWKEALVGDDIDQPGLDALSTIVEEVATHQLKASLGAKRFAAMAGPAIRASTFVINAWYSALMSAVAAEGVLKESDVLGQSALAMGALQRQFKNNVDARNLCRKAGYASPLIAAR